MGYLFKCLNEGCEDDHTYNFKGLCRSCTTYEGGKPIVPVQRVKHNKDGTIWTPPEKVDMMHKPITRREMKDLAAQQKQMSKQKTRMRKMRQERRRAIERGEAIEEEHVHDENCGCEVDFSDIGEAVGEEE